MTVCRSCGEENPDRFIVCGMCGTPLYRHAPGERQRKVVSALFCDVVGSTSLGEELDAETYQHVLFRYFVTVRGVIETHGGSVDKFIGDAVMSVFGVPVLHEDDALRAVRAADEIKDRVGDLDHELRQTVGVGLEVRIGICTGEVFVTEERLATGDAINVAARLEQGAAPGEVLLDHSTARLVRDDVDLEEIEPLHLRGKSTPTRTYLLKAVHPKEQRFKRRFGARLIGRENELETLHGIWNTTLKEQICAVTTVIGAPGVGKSRLVTEFTESLGNATVLNARCLAYGEGITYWPVIEILKQLQSQRIEGDLDESAQLAVDALLGEVGGISSEQIAIGVRHLLEEAANRKPLLIIIDDIQWGQTTFIELIEYIAEFSHSAPILLLCLARPELLDKHPNWGPVSRNVILDPLGQKTSAQLVDELGREFDPELKDRIRAAAEGNPLFVEELITFLRDQGSDTDVKEITLPPTIHALLAARLDQLHPTERRLLEYASVEGEVFHRGAVLELDDGTPDIDSYLAHLVERELIYPQPPQLPNETAYRFRHLLFRDAAYNALPKTQRARSHEVMANWLETRTTPLLELDEVAGYHLEQAYLHRTALKLRDTHTTELATRASDRLTAAGLRSEQRSDISAAQNLLQRATTLMDPHDPHYPDTLLSLGIVAFESNYELARQKVGQVISIAKERGNTRLEARAELQLIELNNRERLIELEDAIDQLDALQPDLTEADKLVAQNLKGNFLVWSGKNAEAMSLLRVVFDRANAEGRSQIASEAGFWLAHCAWHGPMPTGEGILFCLDIAENAPINSQQQSAGLTCGGVLEAMRGLFEQGRQHINQGRTILEGRKFRQVGAGFQLAELEMLAQRPLQAQEILEDMYKVFKSTHSIGFMRSTKSYLVRSFVQSGQYEAAVAAAQDMRLSDRAKAAKAQAQANLGDINGARSSILEAFKSISATDDDLDSKAEIEMCAAEIERLAGDKAAEERHLNRALHLAKHKQQLVRIKTVRERLAMTTGDNLGVKL